MPEWFRPAGWCHSFDGYDHYNSFVFVIYNSEYGKDITEEEIDESLKSFPEKYTIHKLLSEE